MKYHVFIATTQGVVAIQDIIALDDIDIQSLITVNGTATLANISYQYHHFVKKGSGIIEQDFGCCSYRINIEQGIDQGSSWQLAVYLAHVFAQFNLLGNGNVEADDQVIIATGQVNTANRTILAVNKVAEKYHHIVEQYSTFVSTLTQQKSKHSNKHSSEQVSPFFPPIFFIPEANAADLEYKEDNAAHQQTNVKEKLAIEPFSTVDNIVNRLQQLMIAQGNDLHIAKGQKQRSDSQSDHQLKHQSIQQSDNTVEVSPEISALNELERLIESNITDEEQALKNTSEEKASAEKNFNDKHHHAKSNDDINSVHGKSSFHGKHNKHENNDEVGSSLKKYRNSLDETKEVENSLAGLMAPFNPKHIILRVVGFCGFTLFVIALILTFIKQQQSEKEPYTALKITPEVPLISASAESQQSPYQAHSVSLLSQYKENGQCGGIEANAFVNHASSNTQTLQTMNRQQLCHLFLKTSHQVSEVVWLDNNKATIYLLEKVSDLEKASVNLGENSSVKALTNESEVSWRIPLLEPQAHDLSYFLIINYQQNVADSELLSQLTAFVKNETTGLKLSHQELLEFSNIYSDKNSGKLAVYQHSLEVF